MPWLRFCHIYSHCRPVSLIAGRAVESSRFTLARKWCLLSALAPTAKNPHTRKWPWFIT
uniref:Uncharacterized protein n=1 Tax=Hyaloperonospora arabidopsidis (strain Emoy2) TaxID=559515 RepID=M4C1Y9_HYAAE